MNPTPSPNTPGLAGYLLAIGISWCALLVAILVPGAATAGFVVADTAAVVIWLTLWIVVVGIPIGGLGAFLVHAICADEPRQFLHVLVAGLVGWAIPFFVLIVVEPGAGLGAPLVGVPVGVCAMIGRAAVVPLVHSRRERLALGA